MIPDHGRRFRGGEGGRHQRIDGRVLLRRSGSHRTKDALVRPQLQFVGIANEWRTIVGVAPDTRDYALDAEPPHVVYQPFAQEPWPGGLVVRTGTDPSSVARSVVELIHALDREQPIENVRTLEAIRSESLAP